ncbi:MULTISPECIES: Ig domain-containing protein [Rhodococcus]|uniref:Ig domain-containing protein n=1 Tax=Rhodococcus TaxID=1827 RepID=UPI002954EBCD|nr:MULTISPECIES: Ig domain-containing protein [Rhodococcus]MDV7244480.1 Ig domain-containing protein [Rhodococcus oxybenzonivorans]MDV7274277.1 Ig domain-containing protein [Rhodococcus oxybenzonivorans]MDV7337837.1 Ig domain-containing protein [Rhodococcus oxybenzonivorans]MDV7345227.1 Ig domain-containing protein [Rhodococcus oxybenzonivorans]MDV8028915.1 Ig domain-containing protein [Rhodococcus sp. IEGM 27]
MVTDIGQLEVSRHQRELILKPNRAHIYGMGMDIDPIEYITEGSNSQLAELPEGAWDFGLLLKDDAITLTRELEKSDISAIGYSNPVRSDFISDIAGIQFTGLEANRYNIENNLGVDLSQMIADPETGEIAFDQPAITAIRQQRYLALTQFNTGEDRIYLGRLLYAGEISEMGEQTISDGEGSLTWPTTVNATVDTEHGVSVRHYFGGPGWNRVLEDAGFKRSALTITTASLPGGTVSVAYSQTLTVTGGTGTKTWSVVTGSLPAGLTLNASTGVISGTPTAAGTSNFTVQVVDSVTPGSVQKPLSIVIAA